MAKYMLGKKAAKGGVVWDRVTDFNSAQARGTSGSGVYLTSQDSGVEVNLDHSYKLYNNLEMIVEMGYIHLMLDQSKGMWGGNDSVRGLNVTDAMKASVFFKYSF
jgi:hypothetical protein